jgi:hypothetical protein
VHRPAHTGRAQRRYASLLRLTVLGALALPVRVDAQVPAEPVLSGRVLLGGATLDTGTVVLHHMSDQAGGEVDSTRVRPDGTFTIPLPGVPNPAVGDLYFASVRHDGVMYFGTALTTAVQLDSLYEIQAYDTLLAPAEGIEVTLQTRNIFLEPTADAWQATDVFQLRNDRDRTVVARPGGRVWSYPLPENAREVMTGEGEFAPGAVSYEDGAFVVRAAMPPGERLFVVRYLLDSPEVTIPTPGETEFFDLLVREPAPPLEVDAMQQVESIELEAGQTFRRYATEDVATPFVRVVRGEVSEPPPVHWIAVVLTLVLAAGGLAALRGRAAPAAAPVADRQAILVQLAGLDEAFERKSTRSAADRREYQRRRAELMGRLKTGR